jgi:hypothetical protein
MPTTYKLIQTVTVGGAGASTIEFTSIPQIYTDLKLVISSRAAGVNIDVQSISFNGGGVVITGSRYLDSNNSGSPRQSALNYYQALSQPSTYTAGIFASSEIYIGNYSSTSYPKSLSSDSVLETNAVGNYIGFTSGWWNSTSAITTLTIQNQNGNFVQYSSASLYGIKNS